MSREIRQRIRSWAITLVRYSGLGRSALRSAILGFATLGWISLMVGLSPAQASPVQNLSLLERSSLSSLESPTSESPSLEQTLRSCTLTRPSELDLQPSDHLQALTRLLTQSQVIYLGETHDSEQDHQIQLEILQALQVRNPKLILAMEMFQRPYQSVLDRYLKRELSESELIDRTEYLTRWGFPWTLYENILRFSQLKNIPVVALNTPTEVTRKVGRKGLESLTLADRRFIPPLSEIQIGPVWYRDRIQQIYTEMHQGKGNSDGLTRFFQAQVLWDETMADRIAWAVREYPDHQIVVLVGQGHLLYGDGIPDRVMRRLSPSHPGFSQVSLILNPDPSLPLTDSVTQRSIADWLLQRTPEPSRP